jgi:hypothetical protein
MVLHAAYGRESFDNSSNSNSTLQDVFKQYNVNYDLVLLFKQAGMDLVAKYGVDPSLPKQNLDEAIYQLSSDKVFSKVSLVSPDVITQYGIDDQSVIPATERADRINALYDSITEQQKVAGASYQTNFNSIALQNRASTAPIPTGQPVPVFDPGSVSAIDPSVYKNLNTMLQDSFGRTQLGFDPSKLDTVNAFLKTYPYRPGNDNSNTHVPQYWVDMSVRKLFVSTIQTAIDIINDLSTLFSEQKYISSLDFRRGVFEAFARPDRRTYVGIWLILFSFILYFIDSAA